jgi:hypothetical protein
MPATVEKHKGGNVFHRHVQLLCQEMTEARAVQHTRHAHDLGVRHAGEFLQRPDHGVQRIGDADDKGARAIGLDAFAHRRHHLEVDAQQVVAAHARLARHAGGDDHHIGAGDIGVTVGAPEFGVEAVHRTGLAEIQRLALRQAFHDVEDHHIAQFLQGHQMGQRAADLSTANESDFPARHGKFLEKIAGLPNPWKGRGQADTSPYCRAGSGNEQKKKAGCPKASGLSFSCYAERSLDRFLQFLGGAERDLLGRLDLDRFAGGGIAAHARTALAHHQDAQSVETDAGALFQVLGDQTDNIFQNGVGALLGEFVLFGQLAGELTGRDGFDFCFRGSCHWVLPL